MRTCWRRWRTVRPRVGRSAGGSLLAGEVLGRRAVAARAGGVPGLVSVMLRSMCSHRSAACQCRMRRSRNGRPRSRPPVTSISTSRPDGSAPSTHLAPWCSDSLSEAQLDALRLCVVERIQVFEGRESLQPVGRGECNPPTTTVWAPDARAASMPGRRPRTPRSGSRGQLI